MKDRSLYLFNDEEHFNYEIMATSWRDAIAQARDIFSIKGRIVLVSHVGATKAWNMSVSGYQFMLTLVG